MKHLTTPRRLQRSRGLPAVRRRAGRRRWLAALKAVPLAVALLGVGMSAGAQGYYRAQALPLLPPQGFPNGEGWTLGKALNDSGMVVGWTQIDTALRWSFAEGLRGIGPSAQAHAIAGDGTAVGLVRILEEGRVVPALWSTTSGPQLLRDLYTGAPESGMGIAVNNQGWVVALDATSTRSVLLRPGQDALTLGWSDTVAGTGDGVIGGRINASGMVAGTTWDLKGGYWTEAGGVQSFSVLASGPTYVTGLSDSGLISGWGLVDGAGSPQGYVWDAITHSPRALLPGFQAQDVNNAGVAVGVLGNDAAVWRGGQVLSLNGITADLGPYSLYQAWDVNNSGQILALGKYVGGDPQFSGPGLKTFVLAECLRCGQIDPNPNPNSVLLDVGPDWFDAHNALDYRNQGTLQLRTVVVNFEDGVLRNSGELTVLGPSGLLTNRGQLHNEASGRVVVSGGLVQSADGRVVNTGIVSLLEGGSMRDQAGSAWFDDPGATFQQLGGSATLSGRWLADRSTWRQTGGRFTVDGTGALELSSATASVDGELRVGGRLELLPNLQASPGTPSSMTVQGTLEVLPGGTVLVARSWIDVAGGSMVSRGTLDLANGAELLLRDGAGLTLAAGQAGTRDGGALLARGYGSFVEVQEAASFTNRSDTVIEDGAWLRSRGLSVNESTGVIALRGDTSVLAVEVSGNLDAQFTNRGIVSIGGTSEMHVQGIVRNEDTISVGRDANLWIAGGTLHIARGASIQGQGSLVQEDGATFVDGLIDLPFIIFDGGSLGGTGTLRGSVIRLGSGLEQTGMVTIQPGHSPGTLTFEGPTEFANVRIELELESHRSFDRIVVAGPLNLGQVTVAPTPYGGWVPDLNDSFAWLSAPEQVGNVSYDLSALAPGWRGVVAADGASFSMWNDAAVALAPSPNPNPAGMLVTVGAGSLAFHEAGVAYLNEGTVEVGGALAIRPQAVFVQRLDAQLAVLAGGRLSNRGSLGSDGRSDNAGTLVNYEDGQIWASGEGGLANRGRIDNDGLLYVARRLDNEAGGEIVNRGRLETPFGADVSNRGRIVNHGTVANGGWITNLEGGEFVVAAGATVEAAGPWGLDEYRDFGGITQVDGRLQASRIWLNGATVRGSGTLAGPVDGQARFDLGAGHTLTVDGSLAGWHWFDVALDGTDAFGQLAVSGDTAFGGGLVTFFLVEGGYQPQAGDSFRWLQVGGAAQGLELLNYQILVQADGYQYAWSAPADLRVSFQGDLLVMQPVPEPGTWALWLAGLGVLAGLARRRLPARRAETLGH